MKFENIVKNIDIINGISISHSESWSNLTFEGVYSNRYSSSFFSDLYDAFVREEISKAIVFYIDNERILVSDFIEELDEGSKWKIHINKASWLGKFDSTHVCHTFFYYIDSFIKWVKESNPFEDDYPLNNGRYHIYVKDFCEDFGGPNFLVNGSDSSCKLTVENSVPDLHVEHYIRINCNSDFRITPHKHIISWGDVNSVSRFFYRNAILVFLASLCDEITKDKKVIIKGYKYILMEIGGETLKDGYSLIYYNLLFDIYKWIYTSDDSQSIKKRLFAERASLDLYQNLSLYDSLYPILKDIYSQIKEQYSYIMYDRKDSYQKELKDMLKDIKSTTDLFSNKIRNILGNLMRDVLAALILIGITLFSKVTEVNALFDNNLISYVFKAFGVYFWCSAILQTIFDCVDINRSFKELDYWENITRSYISADKYSEYKEQTVNKRFKQLLWYYIFIILLYIGIGCFCYNFQSICKTTTLFQNNKEQIININDSLNKIPNRTNILIEEKNDTII